jgi:hypothetical protein
VVTLASKVDMLSAMDEIEEIDDVHRESPSSDPTDVGDVFLVRFGGENDGDEFLLVRFGDENDGRSHRAAAGLLNSAIMLMHRM